MNGSTLLRRNNALSIVLRLVKIGYLKVISSKSFLFRGYGVAVNAAPKLHPSRQANQKRRHMFLRLWGIQTRYCAPISRRSLHHFSMGIAAVPKELENNAYAKFWGAKRYIIGNVWRVLFRPRFSFRVAVTHLTFRTTKEKTHQKTAAFWCFTNRWTRTQARLNGFSANDARSKKMFNEQNNKKFARASFVHHRDKDWKNASSLSPYYYSGLINVNSQNWEKYHMISHTFNANCYFWSYI